MMETAIVWQMLGYVLAGCVAAILVAGTIALIWLMSYGVGRATDGDPSVPRCPHCGSRLRRLQVRDLANPPSPTARWSCHAGTESYEDCYRRVCYFSDVDSGGKPAPLHEV
jgi:hypothetical protein